MNKQVKLAFVWKFLERVGAQGASFVLTIILARLLTPDDYGVIALITVFISVATVFVQAGFNSALIQKKEITGTDYSSCLLVSIAIAALLYTGLYMVAPFIAQFYRMDILKPITRVLALVLFPGAINSIQIAKLTRELRFKVLFVSSTTATVLSAGVGIFLAWHDKGPWSLVAQQLSCQVLNCIIMLPFAKWKVALVGGTESIKQMLPFGTRILVSNIMVSVFLNLRSLIIGKVYTSGDLGFFNRGKQFPQTIMESINGTIQSVLLPIYARKQDNLELIRNMVRKSVRLSNYLIFPMLVGISCVADSVVYILLTEKWMPCVPFIQFFAISYMCQPTQIITAQAMRAVGDSKTPLRIEFFRKIIELALLFATIPISVKAIGASSALAGIGSILIAMKENSKVIGYSIKEQCKDILEPLGYSCVMALAVMAVGSGFVNPFYKMLVQVIVGAVVYFLLSILFRSQCLDDLKNTLIKRL